MKWNAGEATPEFARCLPAPARTQPGLGSSGREAGRRTSGAGLAGGGGACRRGTGRDKTGRGGRGWRTGERLGSAAEEAGAQPGRRGSTAAPLNSIRAGAEQAVGCGDSWRRSGRPAEEVSALAEGSRVLSGCGAGGLGGGAGAQAAPPAQAREAAAAAETREPPLGSRGRSAFPASALGSSFRGGRGLRAASCA